jgi:hypothetical protein
VSGERKTMTKRLVAVFSVLFVLSCTSARSPDTLDDDTRLVASASFDRAWWAVGNVLAEHGWPVETESEVSGSIATEFVLVGVNRDRNACPTFVGDNKRIDQMRCKLIVHVRSLSDDETEIQVNAILEGRVVASYTSLSERFVKWTPCTSTGSIEKEILHAIEVELL